METTREHVLRFVRGHKEATVADLAGTLGVSHQAVRRHLDGLRAAGMIDVRQVRHGVGRPALVFFATELGEEGSGRAYLQLLGRLFRQFDDVDGEGAGRQTLDNVFSGIAAEVAAEHLAEVHGLTLDERVPQVSHALEREGIVDGWHKEGESFHMLNNECPYLRLAEMSDAPCRSDRRSIELLVGMPVEQTRRIIDGAPVCEYIIKPELTRAPEEATKSKERG